MKTLWLNLRWKLVAAVGLSVIIWFAGGLVGFPEIFRLFFIGYIWIAVPFFVLLDTRFGIQPRFGALSVLAVFLVASAFLILAGCALPQYDPRVEQEKIARLQRSWLDRQRPQRIAALKKELETLGANVSVEQAEGGEVHEVEEAEEETPSAELIAKGRQAFEDWECTNCHKIGGKGGVKRRGPALDNIGNLLSRAAIRAKLLDPRVFMSEEFEEEYDKITMPDDFGDRMSEDEINALVAYLTTLKDTSVETPKPLFPGTLRADSGPFYEIPVKFQVAVPKEWWTDPKIAAEGKAVYEGQVKSEVVCSACHGRDGLPVLTGAMDFRNKDALKRLSDFYWYWRINRGITGTAMTAWGEKLSRTEILKVMVYENSFAYGGKLTDHYADFEPHKAKK